MCFIVDEIEWKKKRRRDAAELNGAPRERHRGESTHTHTQTQTQVTEEKTLMNAVMRGKFIYWLERDK